MRLFVFLALIVFASQLTAIENAPAQMAVASAHPLATEAGLQMLRQGGNAFDAAVAISAVLAVVEPYSSGLGGGGFWLLHRAEDDFNVMVDGREKAPFAATPGTYLDARGEVQADRSINGPLAAGIPGEAAALAHIASHYGQLPLAVSLAPAIRLAEEGFEADPIYKNMLNWRKDVLSHWPQSAQQFMPKADGRIRQPELAGTLRQLAEKGAAGFYSGQVAARLVAGVRSAGGIWTAADLAEYRVVERKPVKAELNGMTIISASPPSSGGVVLAEIMQILAELQRNNAGAYQDPHFIIEAMRLAYRDRARYLGDPDFVDMPLQRLLSRPYAIVQAEKIDPLKAGHSKPLTAVEADGPHTTHFSVLDKQGNRVAATLSINYPFGSGFVAPGTGVLLNDEMDDFVAKPGVPNVYGLVGGQANSIEPGKRMLSSMTPTFIETDDAVAILGTPGGSRIISMVLLATLEMMDGKSPQQWVTKRRYHHQYLPDVVEYEKGAFSAQQISRLQAMGHKLKQLANDYGNMQAIYWDKSNNRVEAASDSRGIGSARVQTSGSPVSPL
ncbi:MAG: gamma-glutamyltransferase [gamma proteobacterium symbiont of Bathyaustriella thionipta]|nr:gamma-glutamyltransferase [gamma proteobacterium symbiont of Bathyaustriella thionipta]